MQTARGQDNELVGLFADREAFESAVAALLAAGFDRTDLSVLSSRESIDVAGRPARSWKEALIALVGELKYEGPLVASGAIVLAGGPTAAALAGVIGAAVGGLAVKELLEEVTAKPHTEDFARSLAAGSVVLWVRVEDDDRATRAARLLEEHGAANVHLVPPSALMEPAAPG
jgi:hypothetical protein